MLADISNMQMPEQTEVKVSLFFEKVFRQKTATYDLTFFFTSRHSNASQIKPAWIIRQQLPDQTVLIPRSSNTGLSPAGHSC